MVYFGVQWPIISSYLAVQEDLSAAAVTMWSLLIEVCTMGPGLDERPLERFYKNHKTERYARQVAHILELFAPISFSNNASLC